MAVSDSINQRFTNQMLGGATFKLDIEAANERTVSIQLLDKEGREMQQRASLWAYLSSDANGDALEAVSGTLTIASGTDGIVHLASAANSAGHSTFMLTSEADGDIDVSITQTSGADTFYLVLVMPDGSRVISGAITFA